MGKLISLFKQTNGYLITIKNSAYTFSDQIMQVHDKLEETGMYSLSSKIFYFSDNCYDNKQKFP